MRKEDITKSQVENEINIVKRKSYAHRGWVHKAGHIVMAKEKGIPYSSISEFAYPACVKEYDGDIDTEYIKNYVMILYSGAIAEELILKHHGFECMKDENSDFQRATKLIKEYLLITDESLSKLLIGNKLEEKAIALSKQWYAEAKKILKQKINLIEMEADDLKNNIKIEAEYMKDLKHLQRRKFRL